MAFSVWLETGSAESLQTFLDGVVAFCTDMGTEHSLASLGKIDFQTILPHAYCGGIAADDGLCMGACDQSMPQAADDLGCRQQMFKLAFPVSGLKHMCHYITDGLLEQGGFKDRFLPRLSQVSHFFNQV